MVTHHRGTASSPCHGRVLVVLILSPSRFSLFSSHVLFLPCPSPFNPIQSVSYLSVISYQTVVLASTHQYYIRHHARTSSHTTTKNNNKLNITMETVRKKGLYEQRLLIGCEQSILREELLQKAKNTVRRLIKMVICIFIVTY